MTQQSDPTEAHPAPGAEPKGNPIVRWLTVLVGLLLLCLASVIGRDLWYRHQEYDPQNSWLRPAFDWFGSARVDEAGVTVGILMALVGLWFILAAVKPRPRRYIQVISPTSSIWVRPVDIARKSTATVRSELGQTSISSRASRRALTVNVVNDGSTDLEHQLATTLTEQAQRLKPTPRVKVNVLPAPSAKDMP